MVIINQTEFLMDIKQMLLKGNSSKISAKGVYKWFRLSRLWKEKSFVMYTQYGTLTSFWLMNVET